jgi:hypothetical protein
MIKTAAEKKGSFVAFLAEPVDKIALKSGEKPGQMHHNSLPRAEWKQWTYAEYYQECKNVGNAMLSLGMHEFLKGVGCVGGKSLVGWQESRI